MLCCDFDCLNLNWGILLWTGYDDGDNTWSRISTASTSSKSSRTRSEDPGNGSRSRRKRTRNERKASRRRRDSNAGSTSKRSLARPTRLASWCSWSSGRTATRPISFLPQRPTLRIRNRSSSFTKNDSRGKAKTNSFRQRRSLRMFKNVTSIQTL